MVKLHTWTWYISHWWLTVFTPNLSLTLSHAVIFIAVRHESVQRVLFEHLTDNATQVVDAARARTCRQACVHPSKEFVVCSLIHNRIMRFWQLEALPSDSQVAAHFELIYPSLFLGSPARPFLLGKSVGELCAADWRYRQPRFWVHVTSSLEALLAIQRCLQWKENGALLWSCWSMIDNELLHLNLISKLRKACTMQSPRFELPPQSVNPKPSKLLAVSNLMDSVLII